MHLLSEMWATEGVRREGERAQQLVFMREGLKSKGWASSKTWLSCAICHSGTRLPLDPAPPFPAVPHQRFAATFVWHKFCTRKQSNTQGAVGGVTFYEHAMHILIKWQAEWQTNCQPACSALLGPGLASWGLCLLCKYAGQIDSVGRRNCVSKVENKTRRMRNFNRKPPQMYANITRIRHVNNIHITEISRPLAR